MKNKEKYDLTKLEVKIKHEFNGCGKIIPGKNTLEISYEEKILDKSDYIGDIVGYLMRWLENEDSI